MIIRSKKDNIFYLEKLGVNYFPEKLFNPKDTKLLDKIERFLNENSVDLYVMRDVSNLQGKMFFNISKNEVYENLKAYTDWFSIAVSSQNYGKYELIGDIYISKTLEEFWIIASDNPKYSTRDVLKDPKWNYSTNYYDKRLKYIPNIDKIVDYIFKYGLFNVVVEFAVYPYEIGKNKEYVAIFELRTNY